MVSSLKCPVSSVPKLAVAETSEVQLCLTPVRRVPYLTAFIFSVIQSPGGVLAYKRLMGMCRWMGSHFHD